MSFVISEAPPPNWKSCADEHIWMVSAMCYERRHPFYWSCVKCGVMVADSYRVKEDKV